MAVAEGPYDERQVRALEWYQEQAPALTIEVEKALDSKRAVAISSVMLRVREAIDTLTAAGLPPHPNAEQLYTELRRALQRAEADTWPRQL